MGLIKSIQWDAECDLCHNDCCTEVDFWAYTKRDFLSHLRDKGWRLTSDGHVWCPKCRANGEEEKLIERGHK